MMHASLQPPAHEDLRPLVSVIIPVYNRIHFLSQAITSAVRQTHDHVEVIVVDDGSPVDPAPVVAEFGSSARLIRKQNGGLASARNFGIAQARGEYLSFLDDDDYLEPTALSDLLQALREVPGSLWAAGRFNYVDENRLQIPRKHPCQFASGNVYREMIHNNLLGAPSVVLASASAVRELGGFDATRCYHMAEDWDLWLSLSRLSPLAATCKPVSNYRIHRSQFTQTHVTKHIRAMLAVFEKQQGLAPPGYDEDFRQSFGRIRLELADHLYLNGQKAEARTLWKQLSDAGIVKRQQALYRRAKSYLPTPLMSVLRRLAMNRSKALVKT
jgi:glycosyltransferase involved in cell wall biosynthesis